MTSKLAIKYKKTEELIPYVLNSRTHTEAQVAQIAASIREFGFTNPILLDGESGILAGHGRVMAARLLQLDAVPTIEISNLTESQKKAYVIADNKLALNAGWDENLLALEIEELKNQDYDIELLGFSNDELKELNAKLLDGINKEILNEKYTNKIDVPIYKPQGEKPEISELLDKSRYETLIEEIYNDKEINDQERAFLIDSATRHIVFDYQQIAEYYSHSNERMQKYMEDSALVIIDFDKAIENGFVKLTYELKEMFDIEDDE
jgi:hypothetical protein